MRRTPSCAVAATLLLAACAAKPPLTSSLETARTGRPPPSFAGVATASVTADQVDALVSDLVRRLESAGALDAKDLSAALAVSASGTVRLRLDAERSFAPGTAQLEPGAVNAYARLAEVLAGAPAVVVHALVWGPAENGTEPWTALPARRAASLRTLLAGRGVAPQRLRAEGRVDADRGARVELVLRPVIRGREAEAWAPPDA